MFNEGYGRRGIVALVWIAMGLGACAPAGAGVSAAPAPPMPGVEEDAAAAAALHSAGKEASLAVLPTRVAGRTMAPVGEVVALLLERSGMTHLSLPAEAFTPPADADLAARAAALGAFVREHPGDAAFTLFTDFEGAPATGFTAIGGMIVDRQGRLAWCERFARGDATFDRAKVREPMDGCVFIAERLRPVLGLGDFTSNSAPQGPIAARLRGAAGTPAPAELEAMKARAKEFCSKRRTASIAVVPTRLDGRFSTESAVAIASGLSAANVGVAVALPDGPRPARPSTMNQEQVMWSLGRELSAWVKAKAPDADYILMADELVGAQGVLGVQVVLCDRRGELVLADLQNDHQPLFRSIAPKDAAGCDRLVAALLEARCR